jgi:hypothetical protein
MSEPRSCPMCDGGEMVRSQGKLEQCGDTYLPTTVSSCSLCGYAKFEPAVGVHWRSEGEPVPVIPAGPLRAA